MKTSKDSGDSKKKTKNTPPMQKKKVTKTRAKKRAWTAFSEYIRTRDTKPDWPTGRSGKCVTCQRTYDFKQLQAGHFIPGRMNSVLFHEELVYPQCYSCNMHLGGNPRAYDRFMRSKYSPEEIEEFDKLPNVTKKYTVEDLLDLEKYYKNKTKEILQNEL